MFKDGFDEKTKEKAKTVARIVVPIQAAAAGSYLTRKKWEPPLAKAKKEGHKLFHMIKKHKNATTGISEKTFQKETRKLNRSYSIFKKNYRKGVGWALAGTIVPGLAARKLINAALPPKETHNGKSS